MRLATARGARSATTTRRARVQVAAASGSASHSSSFSATRALPAATRLAKPSRASEGDAARVEPSPPRWRVARYSVNRSQALAGNGARSEEHTSELQSRPHLVCRLLLEKKK